MSKLDNFVFGQPAPQDPALIDLENNLDKYFVKLRILLNQGLDFADNFNCFVTTITTDPTPGNTTVITHSLKRVPVGFLVLEQDKSGNIFKSSKTAATYTLKADVGSITATIVIL